MVATAPKRLLIIDDDESLRELFRITLEKAGYQVAGAADGLLGLAKAKVFKPALIVLDLMMPRLTGFDVLRRMPQEGLGAVPVIVITGYSDSAAEQVVRQEANVVAFLRKPVKYAELAELIGRLLA